ncbi:ciliogenesis-associated TTC17-interacting protein [Suncus etruscus]|uniref:ciliogenesis-associated TTC17-interacting protein n=1 Tax=Suncus etruscus TaxID=109475 RepID=UPI0021101F45|nr:ciliogenesis-associated TTC17-interacting protein [Suncus etruscus]
MSSNPVFSGGTDSQVTSQVDGPDNLHPIEANADAILFLNSLQQEELQLFLFSETLVMVSDSGEPQGELTIQVQKGSRVDEFGIFTHCLFVHAFSRGFINKTVCGNSLQGYLSWNMEILEQQSQEFIKLQSIPMEQKLNLVTKDDRLIITRRVKEGEDVKTERITKSCSSIAGFISEAANLVLLRVMAWRQMVPSNARFLALDTEGKLCHSTYQCLGSQTVEINHQQVEVFVVEQNIHSQVGIPSSCQFYLLSDGHLAKRIQVGSPACCMIFKMPNVREKDEIESPPVFGKKDLVWEEDAELYSKFIDRKEELRLSHSRYLGQHPEAKAIISDFLLFLLLSQPEDVVTFASEHFSPYSPFEMPLTSWTSKHRLSLFCLPVSSWKEA